MAQAAEVHQLSVLTKDQVEAKSKLEGIGWKWGYETIKKGVLRLYTSSEPNWEERGFPLKKLLVAEVMANGAVRMGEATDPLTEKGADVQKRAGFRG